jgi:hypothetical protein
MVDNGAGTWSGSKTPVCGGSTLTLFLQCGQNAQGQADWILNGTCPGVGQNVGPAEEDHSASSCSPFILVFRHVNMGSCCGGTCTITIM